MNDSAISIPPRSAITPLAGSITTRLVNPSDSLVAQREGEHVSDTCLECPQSEGRPARRRRIGQVRHQNNLVIVICVRAGTLAQGVLQVLDEIAHIVSRAERCLTRRELRAT